MKTPDYKSLLLKSLSWESAHVNLETAVSGLTLKTLSDKHKSFPYTIWQLIEHIRITQADVIEYCTEQKYENKEWPKDYWPAKSTADSIEDFEHSIKQIKKDLAHFNKFINQPEIDLLAIVPNSKDHTYLRELLILIDHTAYHTGQIVLMRKILGDWG